MNYEEFIAGKAPRAELSGFEPADAELHPSLLPHQREIARWALRGGQRAVFASFGLGKTRMHLQAAASISRRTGKKYLIVAPLGVRQEFTKVEGPAMGLTVAYCRTDAEVANCESPLIITNYERVRDGGITVNPDIFAGAGLDEASVLRSFGSKTYQTFLQLFSKIRYRFVFTATPSPNQHKELIHYAGFLGVMDTGQALTRFFRRDSEKAGNLTLYPHMAERFWEWVSTWAVFLQKPSDLGFDDTGYDLPPLTVRWHQVDVDHTRAWSQTDSWGQAQLFLDQSSGLKEVAAAKRETMLARVMKAKELMEKLQLSESKFQINSKPEDGDAAPLTVTPAVTVAEAVIDEALNFVAGQYVLRQLLAGQKWGAVFRGGGVCGGPAGWNWFGNAKGLQWTSAAGESMAVKPRQIVERARQYQPAAAPVAADGARRGLLIWHDLEAERHLLEKLIPEARTVYGTQDLEEREELILGFGRGEFPILATKPVIAGSGCNFQRHCADAIFLGSTYKFNDFIQAVHRIYRFQQRRPVTVHVIYAENEAPVIETLKAKWRQHNELVGKMTEILRSQKLNFQNDMKLTRDTGCERTVVAGETFTATHNDCVVELPLWGDNSVDLIVTSIPFGNQYEYSPNYADFGHNPDNQAFFAQMEFLAPQLLRVLKPGRLACLHVKDRVRFGNVTGLGTPTVDRFSDQAADLFERHGFMFMGRITVDTDVVRENNQTYRLGWSENAKDSTKMGVGMPEYVMLLRKRPSDLGNAYADTPVTKDKGEYTRAQWQIDAAALWKSDGDRLPDSDYLVNIPHAAILRMWRGHCQRHGYDYREHVEIGRELESRGKLPASFMLFPPISRNDAIWTDIARMRVLNSEQGKRHQENHVCPLQLDIAERLIIRYSNRGEVVLDPFAGIFTVPYVAIKSGRIGRGIELSEEYWRCGVGYCEQAEAERTMPTLFDFSEFEPGETECVASN
jgi:DNA modification methylase